MVTEEQIQQMLVGNPRLSREGAIDILKARGEDVSGLSKAGSPQAIESVNELNTLADEGQEFVGTSKELGKFAQLKEGGQVLKGAYQGAGGGAAGLGAGAKALGSAGKGFLTSPGGAATAAFNFATMDRNDPSSIGGAVGSTAGAAIGSIGGPLGSMAGGFIGDQLGSAVGGLFGDGEEEEEPKTPMNDVVSHLEWQAQRIARDQERTQRSLQDLGRLAAARTNMMVQLYGGMA